MCGDTARSGDGMEMGEMSSASATRSIRCALRRMFSPEGPTGGWSAYLSKSRACGSVIRWAIIACVTSSSTVFPQLDEWDVPDPLWCAACPGTRAPKNTVEELVTHAMIAHRMTEPQARDLLKYADQPPVGPSGLNIRRKAQRIERVAEAEDISPISMPSPDLAVSPHICNFCGDDFPKGLTQHMKFCKSRPLGTTSGDQAEQVSDAPVMEEDNAEASLRTST